MSSTSSAIDVWYLCTKTPENTTTRKEEQKDNNSFGKVFLIYNKVEQWIPYVQVMIVHDDFKYVLLTAVVQLPV